MKPFSEACERNREPILRVLRDALAGCRTVLEIGSGTGQHAVYFAEKMPELTWQTSDREENHDGIRAWIQAAGLPNVTPPLAIDACDQDWGVATVDAVFSANTAHIMSWPQVECMLRGVAGVLRTGGVFCLYGPFMYGGAHTADSNARFDEWLRTRDPHSGIRDVDDLKTVGSDCGLELVDDHEMPANNRTLLWRKA